MGIRWTVASVVGLTLLLPNDDVAAAAPAFEGVGLVPFSTEGLFTGTRSEGMGGADVAGARGAEAQLLNPAPLSEGPGAEVAYETMDWFIGDFQNIAVGGEWRGWRVGLLRNEYSVDSQRVRTAFEPEGTQQSMDLKNRIDVAGASWSSTRRFEGGLELRWGLGADYRRYSSSTVDSSLHLDTFDAGITVGVAQTTSTGTASITTAVAWQNVFDNSKEMGIGRLVGPRPLRWGATADLRVGLGDRFWQEIGLSLAYAHTFDLREAGSDDDQLGAELRLLRRLFLRIGNDGGLPGDGSTLGAGVLLAEPWTGPFALRLDWSRTRLDSPFSDEDLNAFGGELRYSY